MPRLWIFVKIGSFVSNPAKFNSILHHLFLIHDLEDMKYKSTRGGDHEFSFEQAICSGYAPDGGLFVPSTLPSIDVETLIVWSKLTFPELAYEIMRLFISTDEIKDSDLLAIVNNSFSSDIFDDDTFVPVKKIGSYFIAELFHGPTFCFKDIGMRPVIQILSYFSTLRNKSTTLLVSTTGDTGPAAVRAVSDTANPRLNILVHYPDGQISEFQRRQMTTVDSKCVKVVKFDGGGDDMDGPIKEILLSGASNDINTQNCVEGIDVGERSFCGINSYNIGRPMVQMVHFVWTYLRVTEQLNVKPGDRSCAIDFVVPTGAMGNITGGYIAKKMGVPIGTLCAGVNINDITHRVIQSGEFHKKKIQKTLSDAINIEVPYNFERLLFYLTGEDHSLVKACMTTMDTTKKLTLDLALLELLQRDFRSARITDNKMVRALRTAYEEHNYVSDPHTAVALAAAEILGYSFDNEKRNPVAILATASPCKFGDVVSGAIGEDGWNEIIFPDSAKDLDNRAEFEPFHYIYREGATIEEMQSEWKEKMLEIIQNNF